MSLAKQGRPAHFVAWLIGERLVRGTVTIVALAAVARHLAPANFGVLNFALAVVSLVTPLAQLGIDLILVRDLVRYPEKTGSLLGTSFALRLAAGIAVAAGLMLAVRFSSVVAGAQPALGPLSLILIAQAGEVADCWFRSRVQSRAVVLIRGSVIVGGAIFKLVLVSIGAGLVAFAWVYAIEAAAFVSGVAICSRFVEGRAERWRFDATVAAMLLREGIGFAAAGFIGALSIRIDQIAVAGTLGDAAAGLYYGALRLMEVPIFVASTTAASLFPALAIVGDDPAMHQKLETIFGLMSAIAWATAIGATIAGPWGVPLLFGEAYRAAWPVFVIHAWATLFLFSGLIRSNFLALRSAPGTQAFAATLVLGIQVLLNLALVRRMGITGAATSFLLTQFVSAWLLPLLLPALRPCLLPQARSLLAPWQPRRWKEFIAAIYG